MKYLLFILNILTVSIWSMGESSAPSLYSLTNEWIDQNERSLTLNSFKGHYVLLSMVYTSCGHSCPLTISKMQNIKKKIEESGISSLKYVMVTFDPINDTPAKLKAFMKKKSLSEQEWSFLSSTLESNIRELSVVLGISYKKLDDGEFSHSNVVTLLNKSGIPIARIDSLSADVDIFLSSIKSELRK